MKLLILSHNPDRASFRQRIGIYLPQLEAAGVFCTVARFPKGYWARWKLFAGARQYDAVLLHKKTLNVWDARILRKHARRIIYDFDDAIMFSPHKPDCRHSSHFRLFERTMRLVDCVIAGNAWLAGQARPFCSNIHILPTGLDTSKFCSIKKTPTDDKIRLVWIGSKATLRYLKKLSPVLEQIGRTCPQVVLRIICDDFFDLSAMTVEKKAWSLETEAADLAACDIGLCPLPDDQFTRGKCGFKILQYFAAGLPVIASPVGINADFLMGGKTGLAAVEQDEWIDAITVLVNDASLRQSMGQNGRNVAQQHDAAVIGQRFCALIQDCLR
ncbi:glycosyltransferase family 4 protein [Anaerohalosphaeraceae bacterium U12dextr]